MVNYRLISLALTNRDIATIHSNIVQEYNTLKGYSWKWLGEPPRVSWRVFYL